MGGSWNLFHIIPDPRITWAQRVHASPAVLTHLGMPLNNVIPNILTFNPTLRKRIFQGAAVLAVAGALHQPFLGSGHDPRIPVYDSTEKRGRKHKDNMGADGDLALAMYYNNK
jgi:hypothetical protein